MCKVREEEEQILIVAPYWPTRTWFPELMLLVTAPPWQIPLRKDSTDSETGHLMAPASRPLETSCLVPGRDAEVLGDLPQEVVDTITSARAPSTRHAYALEVEPVRWWCSSHREDPLMLPDQSRAVLLAARVGAKAVSLHPQGLRGRDCCQPQPVEGKVGAEKHMSWVVRFLRGARRLTSSIYSNWDLILH